MFKSVPTVCLCCRASTQVDKRDRMTRRMDGRNSVISEPNLSKICATMLRNPCCFLSGTTLVKSLQATVTSGGPVSERKEK